jgi:hypothetical protein
MLRAATLLAAALLLALPGCGGDDGEPIPADQADNLETLLTQVERRSERRACGALNSSFADLQNALAQLPEGIDSDLKSALEDGVRDLEGLAEVECAAPTDEEPQTETETQPEPEVQTEPPPEEEPETQPPPETQPTPPPEDEEPPGTGGTGVPPGQEKKQNGKQQDEDGGGGGGE